MSLFKRIKRLVGTKLDDDDGEHVDPAKRVRALVVEMSTHLSEARATLAVAVRDERRMERQLRIALAEVDRWQLNAKQALESGREDLAREALKRKLGAKKFLEELEVEHGKLKANVQRIKRYVVDLERKLREAQTRERLLLQKQRRIKQAEFLKERFPEHKQQLLRAALEDLGDDTDRIAHRTLLLEEDPLERRFKELENREELVDDELAELKRDLDEDESTASEGDSPSTEDDGDET